MTGLGPNEWTMIILAVLAALGTGISLLCGGAWWMSAVYVKLAAAVAALKELKDSIQHLWTAITDHRNQHNADTTELWKAHNLHENKLTELDTRMTNVEDRVECLEK